MRQVPLLNSFQHLFLEMKRSSQTSSKQEHEVEMKQMDTSMMEHQLSNQYEQDSLEHVQANYGSFYLRMGAVGMCLFGIHSNIDPIDVLFP
jgi:hypothetical protein